MDAETRIERFLDALRMHLSDSTDATEAFHIRECLTLAEDILDPQPHRVADPESYAALVERASRAVGMLEANRIMLADGPAMDRDTMDMACTTAADTADRFRGALKHAVYAGVVSGDFVSKVQRAVAVACPLRDVDPMTDRIVELVGRSIDEMG